MRSLLAAAILLLTAAASPPKDTLTPAEFRDRIAAVVAAGQKVQTIDERTFRTKAANGTELTISIDNAYHDYRAAPERLDELVTRFAEVFQERGLAGKEPIGQLVVIVRPSNYLVLSLPPGSSLESFVPGRPMAGDLSYFLAVDSPNSIRTAAKSDLARWGIDEAAAWQKAVSHIKERVGPLGIVRLGDDKGPSGLAASSGLAPSILADPALCSQERAPNGSDGQIVLLYARDMFLFAIPSDADGTRRFWRVAKEEIATGRSFSSTPLTCRDGHWVVAPAP